MNRCYKVGVPIVKIHYGKVHGEGLWYFQYYYRKNENKNLEPTVRSALYNAFGHIQDTVRGSITKKWKPYEMFVEIDPNSFVLEYAADESFAYFLVNITVNEQNADILDVVGIPVDVENWIHEKVEEMCKYINNMKIPLTTDEDGDWIEKNQYWLELYTTFSLAIRKCI